MYLLGTAIKEQTDRAAARISETSDNPQEKTEVLRQKGGTVRDPRR